MICEWSDVLCTCGVCSVVLCEEESTELAITVHMYTHTLLTGRLVPNSPAELCNQLYVYDELLAVNGKDVSQVDHNDIVTLVKSSGTSIKLAVQEPEGELHRCVHMYMCNDLPIWSRYILHDTGVIARALGLRSNHNAL